MDRKIKILHILPEFHSRAGGTAYAVRNIATALGAFDCEQTIATLGETDLAVDGVEVHSFSCGGMLRYSKELKVWLEDSIMSFDVVHIHSIWLYHSLVASRLCIKHKVPYVLSPHGMLDAWSMSQKALKKKLYFRFIESTTVRGAAAIHCTLDNEVLSSGITRFNTNVFTVPLCVEEEFFNNDISAERRQKQILFLGRLHYKKQPDLAIEAIAALSEEDPHIKLVIAGDGDKEYVDALQGLVRERNIWGRVDFVGNVSGAEKVKLFLESDVFVLPSLQENFGIAVLEAMAAGCIPVVSDEVALSDVIHAIDKGLVCWPQIDSFTDALEYALDIRNKATMRRAIQDVAQKYFSQEGVGSAFYEMYKSMTESR